MMIMWAKKGIGKAKKKEKEVKNKIIKKKRKSR